MHDESRHRSVVRINIRSPLDPVSPISLCSSLSSLFSLFPRCIDPRDRSVINSLHLSFATQHYVTLLSFLPSSSFRLHFNFSPPLFFSDSFLLFLSDRIEYFFFLFFPPLFYNLLFFRFHAFQTRRFLRFSDGIELIASEIWTLRER